MTLSSLGWFSLLKYLLYMYLGKFIQMKSCKCYYCCSFCCLVCHVMLIKRTKFIGLKRYLFNEQSTSGISVIMRYAEQMLSRYMYQYSIRFEFHEIKSEQRTERKKIILRNYHESWTRIRHQESKTLSYAFILLILLQSMYQHQYESKYVFLDQQHYLPGIPKASSSCHWDDTYKGFGTFPAYLTEFTLDAHGENCWEDHKDPC